MENYQDQNWVQVKVTKDDIERGKPESCQGCPVFLAVSRLPWDGEQVTAVAYTHLTTVTPRNKVRAYNLPLEVGLKIRKFDKTGIMKPFQFNLQTGVYKEL